MPSSIYINATFQISSRRNYHGTELCILTYTEEVAPGHSRLWEGEGRTLWEALANAVYNACEAGWVAR